MGYQPWGVAVEELDGEEIICLICEIQITAEAFWVDEFDGSLCEDCVNEYVQDLETDAKAFAKENCRITRELPQYDDENEYRCTPEEYKMGNRESNTPNAYFARCRHECTNYDELIDGLKKESAATDDHVKYEAIRARIDRILIDEIEANHPNAACNWWSEIGPDE